MVLLLLLKVVVCTEHLEMHFHWQSFVNCISPTPRRTSIPMFSCCASPNQLISATTKVWLLGRDLFGSPSRLGLSLCIRDSLRESLSLPLFNTVLCCAAAAVLLLLLLRRLLLIFVKRTTDLSSRWVPAHVTTRFVRDMAANCVNFQLLSMQIELQFFYTLTIFLNLSESIVDLILLYVSTALHQ